MADISSEFRMSESDYVYSPKITRNGAKITITSVTVRLTDATGTVAGGVDGIPATAYTAGADVEPQAWYLFVPNTLKITPGNYVLAFRISDSSGLITVRNVAIALLRDDQ